MIQDHTKTLELLTHYGVEMPYITQQHQEKWRAKERQLGISLPKAYWDYLVFGGPEILHEMPGDCTNNIFPTIHLVTLHQKGQALLFEEEGYENIYRKYCLLDGSDNPPVLFVTYDDRTIVEYSKTFTEAVYATATEGVIQDPGEWYWVTDFSCLDRLQSQFTEITTTHIVANEDQRVKRYFETPSQGTVSAEYNKDKTPFNFTENDEKLILRSLHSNNEADVALQQNIFELIDFQNVRPETFHCPHLLEDLIEFLDDCLSNKRLAALQYACVEEPSQQALAALLKSHQKVPIRKRGSNMVFSWSDHYNEYNTPNIQYIGKKEGYAVFGGAQWGVDIAIRGDRFDQYAIESIKLHQAENKTEAV